MGTDSKLAAYIEHLGSQEEAERICAAEDLGYTNRREAVLPLADRLEVEQSRAVQSAIFQALLRIEDDCVISLLVDLLSSDRAEIRSEAMDVLQRRGSPVLASLRCAIGSADKDLRKFAVDVAAGLAVPGVEEIFRLALDDEDPNVRITAVEGVGANRIAALRQHVENLFISAEDPMLTAACLDALSQMGSAESLQAVERRFPAIEQLPDLFLPAYVRMLSAHGSPAGVALLAAWLRTRPDYLQPQLLSCLLSLAARHPQAALPESLIAILVSLAQSGGSALIRYQAVALLGKIPIAESGHALESALSDTDRLVRLAAAEAISGSCPSMAAPILENASRNECDSEVRRAIENARRTVVVRLGREK